jgi:predicted  nucleic acid-binding Zn-ribbon protein
MQQQRKIDALTTQIQQMQRQQTELINELKEVKKEIAVPTPSASPREEADENPEAPKTIGE